MEDFSRCTPYEFRAICDSWRTERDRVEHAHWERTRMMCLCQLQPWSEKRLKAEDVMRFPWDQAPAWTGNACGEESSENSENSENSEAATWLHRKYEAARKRWGLT